MDAKTLGAQPSSPVQGNCVDASGAYCGDVVSAKGLTKRELFAAMAMQGLLSRWDGCVITTQTAASLSIDASDALLAELAKDQP